MAEKKISQLTAKGATVADTDLLVVSEAAGGGSYTTKSITGANIKALVTDANLTTTDITTNNVSTSKHGFAPKAPNDSTKFLDGTGAWSTPASGGLTQFTEAANSSAPNGTVPVNSLTATGAATNIDAAIVPKGTGALLANIPDNTATGGNKRGQYAVDWQMLRNANTQVANGNQSAIVGGGYNTVSGANSFTGAGQGLQVSGTNGAAFGQNSNVSGNHSFAAGSSNTVSGNFSCSFGESNTVSRAHSFSAGILNSISSSAVYAFATGYQNTVTQGLGFAHGLVNTISGNDAFGIGSYNTVSGTEAFAFGKYNIANGSNSFAHGLYSSTFGISGRNAFASGQESTTGDAQTSKFVLRERTTGNTATTLTTDSAAAGTTNQVILSNQSAYRFKGSIVGKQSGSTNAAVWDIDGFIVRGANAAATTLNVSNVTLVENTPAWGTPTLAADTTNGGLRVQVTGAAATNIQWTAVIETTEVIYA